MNMQQAIEHFGVAVAAITGVLAARGKQVDLFGVIVLALTTAFGGGTLRDLMLGDTPVFWVRNPEYLLNGFGVAVAAFYAARVREFPHQALLIADAFVLAFFTMVGARKAMSFSPSPAIAVAMGVTTGVVGGMLRDVLVGEMPMVFRPHICLYATAAMAGAFVFVLLTQWFPGFAYAMLVGLGVTLALRLAGIRWKLALPLFESK